MYSICLVVLKDIFFKCCTVSDIASVLQVADTTVKTIQEMQSEVTFFYDEATAFADKVIEISEPREQEN